MPSRRFPADDFTPPPDSVEALPLFAEPVPWPENPPAPPNEQRRLPIEGSTQALYDRWRRTEFAGEVLYLMRRLALEQVAAGATWIQSRGLWEKAREAMQVRGLCDNRLQALACREVEESSPILRGKFRHRVDKPRRRSA